jgi:ABC-type transport system involved in Fe-S cluster assembly fused permease/ATPase subunit
MKGVGAGTRIFDLLAREPVIPPNKGKTLPPGSIGTIKFENIRFAYPKRREAQVLNGFNMEIKPGESVALVYASLASICVSKLISGISAGGAEAGRAACKPSCFVSTTYA